MAKTSASARPGRSDTTVTDAEKFNRRHGRQERSTR